MSDIFDYEDGPDRNEPNRERPTWEDLKPARVAIAEANEKFQIQVEVAAFDMERALNHALLISDQLAGSKAREQAKKTIVESLSNIISRCKSEGIIE